MGKRGLLAAEVGWGNEEDEEEEIILIKKYNFIMLPPFVVKKRESVCAYVWVKEEVEGV